MIQISVDTRRAVVTNKELLTVGSAGIQVQFTLSEDWAGLSKLAVFRVGDEGEKVDVVLDSELTCVVPPEVLTDVDEVLFIGVYGSNGEGTVIIPTIWASAGVVKPGTSPNTPASATPTPEIWAQILSVAQDAEQTATDAMSIVEDAVTHTPIIQDGYWYFWDEEAQEYQSTGIKAEGTDGYSPDVTIADITGGHSVTITDEDHPQGQTFNVMDGTDGEDGEDGDDGYSPAVTITEITGGHRVTITDEAHPTGQSFDVMDGQDGASDAGEVTYDDTATYPSGTVGAALTNQKNAIDALDDTKAPVIINTASGDIASFADGADGMQIRKIVGTIVTAEGGSGWTGANVTRTGKNLFNKNLIQDLHNGILNASGTPQSSTPSGYTDPVIRVNPSTKYILSGSLSTYGVSASSAGGYRVYYYDDNKNFIARSDNLKSSATSAISSFETPANCRYLAIQAQRTSGYPLWDTVQLELGTTVTEFESYRGQTIQINWQTEAGTILNGIITLNEDGSADVVNSDTADSYHLTGVGSLSTFYGQNSVWIDTGAITECDYPADTKLYIDGLTAPDEDMIADGLIASGKYFTVNNQLYLSTAQIAAGAQIIPGSNCTATNIVEALNALNT